MTTYLVDYENVKGDGLNGINNLTDKDKVHIFYCENADRLTFGLHKRLNEAACKIYYQRVEVGRKNALDFQLVSYLGYLLGKEEKEEYAIVTTDNGYTSVVQFWQKKTYKVLIVSDLTKKNSKEVQGDMLKKVLKYVTDKEDAEIIAEYILKYKTKQGFNNALAKKYGTTKGGKLYNSVKPLLQDKKGK